MVTANSCCPAPAYLPPTCYSVLPIPSLLPVGATIVGKTHMSEMAYSLDGNNAHYGTPLNAAAPGRNTGGSSSGSAVSAALLFGLSNECAALLL